MPLVVKDRVKETTTTTGTGTITLAGAVAGFDAFSVIGNANTTYYAIVAQTPGEWEVGIGTYTASGTTLSRDTILASSNSGAAVDFGAGTKDVFVTYPAAEAVTLDEPQTLINKTINSAVLNDGYTEEVFAITDGATVNLDPNNGSIQTWTLSANRTPGQANWAAGQSIVLVIDDDAGYTIDWSGFDGPVPTVVASTSDNFGSSTKGTLTLPTGLVRGDIVIVGVGSDGSNPALPAGWTNITSTPGGSAGQRTFVKVMDTVPDTTVALTGLSTASVAFSVAIRGGYYSAANPFAEATGGSGMPSSPLVPGVAANSIVLALGYLDDDNITATAPSGYTLLQTISASTAGFTAMLAYADALTAGDYTPGAFGGSGSDDWLGVTLAVPSAGVYWQTDRGNAPQLNTAYTTTISLWKVGTVVYGARIGDV
jgi:hypothetical protein